MCDPIAPLTELVDLPGFEVYAQTLHDQEWWIEVRLARDGLVACRECGTVASLKDYDRVEVRDLPVFGRQCVLVWRKRRYECDEAACAVGSWTETSPEICSRKVASERARREMCRRVGQDAAPISGVATDFGVTWKTVEDAVEDYGRPLVDDPARLEGVQALGVDETSFMAATAETPTRYVTSIVDITNNKARLLDVIDGRDAAGVQHWLDHRPGTWLDKIDVCATDAARSYTRGLVDGGLGAATFVLDRFHAIRLGNDAVDDVRRRVQRETTGHRGRRDDPLYRVRKLLLTRYDRLVDAAEDRLADAFERADPYGEVAVTWVARNLLSEVYDAPTEREANKALFVFYTWCVDVEVPEVITLAATIGHWQAEILNYWCTDGASNGPVEGLNLMVKKTKRIGHGYRNFENYRFRLLLTCGIDWDSVPWNTHRTARLRTHKPRLIA